MDRVTEQPEEVALRAEVARLKEELMAARKAKRGVVLPRKPFTGLGLFIHRILPGAGHPHFEDRPYPQKRTEALAWGALGKARIEEVEALTREIFPKGSHDITVVWGFPGVTHLGRWKKNTLALAHFAKRDRAERLIELGHTMPAISFQPDKIYLTCPVVHCPEAPPAE